jgi:hypothetical protein
MSIELVPMENVSDQAWDECLFQMPDWRIFQTSAWLRFIEETHGARPLRLGIHDDGRLVGCWPAGTFSRGVLRIVGSPMRGWNTPYMGPACRELPSLELLKAWRRFLEQKRFHHAQVTNPNLSYDAAVQAGFRMVHHITYVCPIPSTEEGILLQFNRSSRKAVYRAQRLGVEVEITDNPSFVDHYYYQLEDVFGKQGLVPTYSKSCVRALWRIMKPTGRMFTIWAKRKGEVLATGIYFLGHQRFMSFGSASLRSTQDCHPNELVRLLSMKIGAEHGCSTYDMSGGGDYKAKFGAHLEDYFDLLYFKRPWVAWARKGYGKIWALRTRRGLFRQVMQPRPPLAVDHQFEHS